MLIRIKYYEILRTDVKTAFVTGDNLKRAIDKIEQRLLGYNITRNPSEYILSAESLQGELIR